MGNGRLTAYEREVMVTAKELGFTIAGRTRKSHLILVHTNGGKTTIASTPRNGRQASKNARAQLGRIAKGDFR